MLAQILGAQQSLLLRRDCGEKYRAARPILGDAKGASQLEQDAAAGGVISGAVVNVVAGHVWANAEVIVVRGVHYGFVFQFAVGTGQHRQHVIRFEMAYAAHHVRLQLRAQVHRMELARARVGHHFVEIHARCHG
jgi:hypothetical protein